MSVSSSNSAGITNMFFMKCFPEIKEWEILDKKAPKTGKSAEGDANATSADGSAQVDFAQSLRQETMRITAAEAGQDQMMNDPDQEMNAAMQERANTNGKKAVSPYEILASKASLGQACRNSGTDAGETGAAGANAEEGESSPSWDSICSTAGLPRGNDGKPLISLYQGMTGAEEKDILPENWETMQTIAEQIANGYAETGTVDPTLVNKLSLLRAFGDQKVLTEDELSGGADVLADSGTDLKNTMVSVSKAMGLPEWSENPAFAA